MKAETKVRVWDLPVRLFHWLLFALVCVSLYTGLKGGFNEMDYHMLSGYSILALVIFRLAWGFLGSTYTRFSSFLTLRGIPGYARKLFNKDELQTLGHNPLGGLSIVAFLIVLIVQAATGLFANDDIMLEGPLTHLVSDEVSDQLTGIHHTNVWLLYILLGLHISAIAFYELYRGHRLILPMLTGRMVSQHAETNHTEIRKVYAVKEVLTATILIGIAAGFVYWLITEV